MLTDFLNNELKRGDVILYAGGCHKTTMRAAHVEDIEKRKLKDNRFHDVLVVRELEEKKLIRITESSRVVKIEARKLPVKLYTYYLEIKEKWKPRRDPKDKSTWKRCQYCNSPMNPIYDPEDIYTDDNCGR